MKVILMTELYCALCMQIFQGIIQQTLEHVINLAHNLCKSKLMTNSGAI
jgi:hypothetical protein